MGGPSRRGKRTKGRKEDEEHAHGDFRRRWKAKEIGRKRERDQVVARGTGSRNEKG